MSARHVDTPTRPAVRFLRTSALVVGVVFGLIGVLGFVPGVVTDHDRLELWGHHTDAKLLGLFSVSVLHNVLHLLFAVLGVLASRRAPWSAAYLVYGGLSYAAVWVYGLAVGGGHGDVVGLNDADNWLHLGLTLGMTALGIAGYRWWRGGIGGDVPIRALGST
ncbi:DUF4383 domain-containing protein [Nocardioides zeae]|uniref:DUF4383 domain-containing protein n=1 Tax=Nocardioides imazamoxiresistens TaxID=3231893 RepID=A0ABU3PQF3_9ACTN|nr:DUF4383 domain-containing protein [Nocardioides zeae]MDT9591449.1 DUF4383 domain-containing protein [Nocardioides zeae]